MSFVADASLAMAWCYADEATPTTRALLARAHLTAVHVPAVWSLEVANAVLVGERRQRLSVAATNEFIGLLGVLSIVVDVADPTAAWSRVIDLSRDQGLTAYDAAYLELALRLSLPLATLDNRLGAAATRVGVSLLSIESL